MIECSRILVILTLGLGLLTVSNYSSEIGAMNITISVFREGVDRLGSSREGNKLIVDLNDGRSRTGKGGRSRH